MTNATVAEAKRLLPDDILVAILAGTKLERFRSHNVELQSLIYELTNRHKNLLSRYFVFSSVGPRPYSPALSDAISRLQLSGLIGRVNPDYKIVLIKPATRRYFEAMVKPSIEPQQLEELAELSREFEKLVEALDTPSARA